MKENITAKTTMHTSNFFQGYYQHVDVNSILIIDTNGVIIDVNQSFTNHFGYTNSDVSGRHFSMLFTKEDIANGKPQQELRRVLTHNQAQDENYIVDKAGHEVMCIGECVLVSDGEGNNYIVKDIINLQSKKQVQIFLKETGELLKQMFAYSKGVAMMVLDTSLKVQQVNGDFLRIFGLHEPPMQGSRMVNIAHTFWQAETLKKELSRSLVENKPMVNKDFPFVSNGEKLIIRINSKIISEGDGINRKIFLVIQLLPAD